MPMPVRQHTLWLAEAIKGPMGAESASHLHLAASAGPCPPLMSHDRTLHADTLPHTAPHARVQDHRKRGEAAPRDMWQVEGHSSGPTAQEGPTGQPPPPGPAPPRRMEDIQRELTRRAQERLKVRGHTPCPAHRTSLRCALCAVHCALCARCQLRAPLLP